MIRLYSHPSSHQHDPGPGHPEGQIRARVIDQALNEAALPFVERHEAPRASLEQIRRVHPEPYPSIIQDSAPDQGYASLDPDTVMNPASLEATLRASGGVCAGIDDVMAGKTDRAFCLMRPPGHHAEADRAMGFCLFNQIAVGAAHARAQHGLDRVAIVDFDVHHGNGTQAIFWDEPGVFYLSSHQWPLFPGTGQAHERGASGNIRNLTFDHGTGGGVWRQRYEREGLPDLEAFRPELLLISAGFDAHERDPLASMQLVDDDFAWITARLVEIAERHCDGRIIACLEGGYDPDALASSFLVHINELNGP